MGRRSVWSDERVIKLAKQFAPAADEVWRLQRDDDAECRWFRSAVRGKPDIVRGSMQGTYVLTAKGQLLGSRNSANPDKILAMLEGALAKWRELPADERAAPAEQLRSTHRWEDSYPEGGLILERFARDIGKNPQQPQQKPVNRDAVWFDLGEAEGWLPQFEVGQRIAIAEHIVDRMARVVFVDNVRGQTLPFARAELHDCNLHSRVVAMRDNLVDIEITGTTSAIAKGPWLDGDNYWKPKREWPRTLQTSSFGKATFDRSTRRFVKFELVATGTRTGRTNFNGRSKEQPQSTHGIGFLLRLANPSYRVAPTFVNMYGAKWVVPRPK